MPNYRHERQKAYRASKRAADMDDESVKDADVEKDNIDTEEVRVARNDLVALDAEKSSSNVLLLIFHRLRLGKRSSTTPYKPILLQFLP